MVLNANTSPSDFHNPSGYAEESAQLRMLVHILYALYVLSWPTAGLSSLVAVIIGYIKRADLRKTLQLPALTHKHDYAPLYIAHLTWQIRTFWGLLAFTLVGTALLLSIIGLFVLLGGMVWGLYRIIKGWLYLSESRSPT